jgi:hypothetical protein
MSYGVSSSNSWHGTLYVSVRGDASVRRLVSVRIVSVHLVSVRILVSVRDSPGDCLTSL